MLLASLSLGLTLALTTLVFFLVVAPVAALAGRGRRRLQRWDKVPAPALPPAYAAVDRAQLDAVLQGLAEASEALHAALAGPTRLAEEYRGAIPLLEVMHSARSSPRVYPSNWIGEVADAFLATCTTAQASLEAWGSAWRATPQSARAELTERTRGASTLLVALDAEGFELESIRSAAFSYVGTQELDRVLALAEDLQSHTQELLVQLVQLKLDPYR